MNLIRATIAVVVSTMVLAGLSLILPSTASAAEICPASGNRKIVSMDIDGVVKSKSCFSYTDRKLRVADTDVDGYSGRGELVWNTGSRNIMDSNGADNGWMATAAIGLGGDNTVQLRSCTVDLDMQSGSGYYCSVPWVTVTRPSGA